MQDSHNPLLFGTVSKTAIRITTTPVYTFMKTDLTLLESGINKKTQVVEQISKVFVHLVPSPHLPHNNTPHHLPNSMSVILITH